MIAKLKGRIDATGADWLVIDVNGVGYEVFASSRTLRALQQGQQYTLHEVHAGAVVGESSGIDRQRQAGIGAPEHHPGHRLGQHVLDSF